MIFQISENEFQDTSNTICRSDFRKKHTVGELKDWTKRHLWSKTTLISSSVSGGRVNPPFCKMVAFFLGPWVLVCQFIEISNQMEVNGEVTNYG